VFGELPALLEEAQAEVRRREFRPVRPLRGSVRGKSGAGTEGRAAAPSWSRRERLTFEKETLGFYITGHRWTRSPGDRAVRKHDHRGLHALKPDAEVRSAVS